MGEEVVIDLGEGPNKKSVIEWTLDELCYYMDTIKMSNLNPYLREHQVNGASLFELSEQDLKEMNLPMGPRKNLLRQIENLRKTLTEETPSFKGSTLGLSKEVMDKKRKNRASGEHNKKKRRTKSPKNTEKPAKKIEIESEESEDSESEDSLEAVPVKILKSVSPKKGENKEKKTEEKKTAEEKKAEEEKKVAEEKKATEEKKVAEEKKAEEEKKVEKKSSKDKKKREKKAFHSFQRQEKERGN